MQAKPHGKQTVRLAEDDRAVRAHPKQFNRGIEASMLFGSA
jgi:hypothetical protein